ncbi:hypothetical protein [Thalassovita sp.]|uniref:hypothetical protein n=1 Tax=Thalassovita sp. TaxID=1979401 RepID=UPI002AB1252D|nr:hypothetical protein [Thalassovita sp.]
MQVRLNEPQCAALGLFRMALSEATAADRLSAIEVMRHEVVSMGLDSFPITEASSPQFVRWAATTAPPRYEAAHAFHEIAQRYESKNERHLNIAEFIGKKVWDSIQARRFQGLQVAGGLLEQTSDYARDMGVRGAKDLDVLRKIWKRYRGVVHLGMAMDYVEEHPEMRAHVLQLAERIRLGLSTNCPKGTNASYVDPQEQISFLYVSDR